MAGGQGVLTSTLDVGALNAVEGRLEVSHLDDCAAHGRLLRDVLDLHRVLTAAGAGLGTTAQLALLRQVSESAAQALLTKAQLLASLPGGLEAVDCALLTVEQSTVLTKTLAPLPTHIQQTVWQRVQARLLAAVDGDVVLPPARFAETLRKAVIAADARDAIQRRKAAEAAGDVEYRRRDDGLVDLFALGIAAPVAQAVLQQIRAAARPMNSLDDRPAGQRRVQALVDLVLGRERLAFDGEPNEGSDPGAVVRHCGVACGCRFGSPVPCGTDVALLIPLGAALGTTDEVATLMGHGPIEPDLTQAVLHSAPRIRPVWVDEHGVPVATGDRITVPARHDRPAVRGALLRLAAQAPPPGRVPRHPDDHPPDAHSSDPPEPPGTWEPPPSLMASCPAHGRPRVLTHPHPHPTGTPGPYRVPARLRRLVEVRAPRCEWPGCGIAASGCDLDHDLAWPYGPTCGCNVGPLCRRHHQLKQTLMTKTRGQQSAVAWTDPTGRAWTSPAQHPAPATPVRQPAALTVAGEQLLGPGDDVEDDDTDPIRLELRAADRYGDEPDTDRTGTAVTTDAGWGLALDDPYRWAA